MAGCKAFRDPSAGKNGAGLKLAAWGRYRQSAGRWRKATKDYCRLGRVHDASPRHTVAKELYASGLHVNGVGSSKAISEDWGTSL